MGGWLAEQQWARKLRRLHSPLRARCAYGPTFVHVECKCVLDSNVVNAGSQPLTLLIHVPPQ